jgi:thiamine-phosphate pyrophosphorylase
MSVNISLYVILDPEHMQGRDVVEVALAAVRGGATIMQYRDKISDTRTLIRNAQKLKQALVNTSVPLLINDRVDVALASDADGVHLGQSDMHPVDARRLLGADKIIGLTIKTMDHARAAPDLPIDYACIGGVFATSSKHNPEPPLGLSGLHARVQVIRQKSPALPIGAIAGITADNAAEVMAQGVDGIAVLSSVTMAEDVEAATAQLRQMIDMRRPSSHLNHISKP